MQQNKKKQTELKPKWNGGQSARFHLI